MASTSGRTTSGHPTTRWSLVLQQDPAQPARSAMLGNLCARFGYPVYAYLRCSGNEPVAAHDITRAFFGDLLRAPAAVAADAPSRFRDFLEARLREFLARDWRELPDTDSRLPIAGPMQLEARHRLDNAGISAPAQAFQRSYACEIIAGALAHLQQEAAHAGHQDMYAALLPYLGVEPTRADYEAIAGQLGQRPLALIVALRRLRQRFRELVGRELSDTVESAAELDEEQRTLHAFLGPVP